VKNIFKTKPKHVRIEGIEELNNNKK